jgi:DNA topoisomerase 2-associated protein PAT1
MGSPSGDGATVILRSVLERANIVRRDRNALYILQNLNIWQHAFDAFFALLTKYCTNKYDSVIHSLMMSYPGNIPAINAAADEALKKEIPVELLQATLPHTSELQRKLLYDLITKGAGAMSGLSSGANADSRTSNTATVRG